MYICNYKACRNRLCNFYAIIAKCALQKRKQVANTVKAAVLSQQAVVDRVD